MSSNATSPTDYGFNPDIKQIALMNLYGAVNIVRSSKSDEWEYKGNFGLIQVGGKTYTKDPIEAKARAIESIRLKGHPI